MWTATRACLGAALAGLMLAAPAQAGPCATDTFEGVPFTYCEADPARDDIRLFHSLPDGTLLGSFGRVNAALSERGEALGFAMNGAMYHPDRSPVGLYIEEGEEISPLATRPGPGNFGLLPNGVFCVAEDRAAVIETRRFADARPDCRFAAQSGPMLVIDGALHPRFLPRGTSVHIRNGVGVRPDGTVVFAISDAPLNFHRFARLFRDMLGTPNALYIDGKVSRLFAPDVGRADLGLPLGPIVGTVQPQD